MDTKTDMKYCLYARKSSESDERQAMSIDSQIKEMTAMADREGLNIVEIKQESFSAKQSGHRPVFNELLHDLRNGKFEAILTWSPDRMSRNAGDLGSLVDLMDMNKLQRIRTFGQSFSNTPNEKFLLMILCSQAKLENDNRGINVKRGIRAKCEMGWRPGSAPIGYINRSFNGVKDIVIDLDRAPIIKEIFERSGLMHQSGRTIKDWLDESGFTTKTGAKLSLSQIYRILTNPFYYGYFKYPEDGPLYKGLHQPIITKELFDLVRDRIADIVPDDKPAWGSKKFPFKHLFYCGACGSRLTVEEHYKKLKDGTRNRHVYYRCTKSTKDPDCKERSITANMITEQILAMVDAGELDDIEPAEELFKKVEQYKRVTSQLIKDHGIESSERAHFKNYASYILRQGSLSEQDGFIRGLNIPLFVKDRKIYRRYTD
ncbi:recombinase family protein [Candidatus Saccharibacteria bacterium]|nr:recombinase family protein [Candidatus Saccharibacteria bacterium]